VSQAHWLNRLRPTLAIVSLHRRARLEVSFGSGIYLVVQQIARRIEHEQADAFGELRRLDSLRLLFRETLAGWK
jgi:hypothetical protein